MTPTTMRKARVGIVGAGVSGLCMAARLQQAGIDDFVVYESSGSLGGTWSDRTYPGLSCDVPARLFQYSFALNPDWTTRYATGDEVHAYLVGVADRYGIGAHCVMGTSVTSATWTGRRWRITTDTGEQAEFDFLVTACGFMSDPVRPAVPGLESFTGPVMHSARWDSGIDLAGRQVALIGSGASGVQLAVELAGRAGRLSFFQRSAPWVVPRFNRRHRPSTRLLHRRMPGWSRGAYRYQDARHAMVLVRPLIHPGPMRWLVKAVCRAHLHTVRDPELRRKLTPSYAPMCKRIILSSDFYRAVQRDTVDVVTEHIDRAVPDGLITADGRHHPCDVVVLATGYDTHTYMSHIDITGPGGVRLADLWRDGPRSLHGVAVPGLPNLFSMLGPFAPTGAYSAMAVAEMHADFVLSWVHRWQAGELDTVAPSAEAAERFRIDLTRAMRRTVWTAGCKNPYIGKLGVPEISPWSPWSHRKALSGATAADWNVSTGHRDATPRP